ncbi:MAG: bifunctional adenosylcobinamide kinase/adenosylcobinamide-phosphate guanylyltransferase [Pseudomonadota bacterium]
MKNLLPPLTLVLGGASSGKSAWAEARVSSAGLNRHYIATAEAHDAEMTAKIAAHRAARGTAWDTHDAPHDLGVLATVPEGHCALLDCATMWLSNQLLAERDMDAAVTAFTAAVAGCPAPLVVVSNEVGHGIVPAYALGRRFRDAQGQLNQRLAAQADEVVFVTAGLPQVLKAATP